MPVLREHDFDKLATRIVDQFLDGKTKLADAAAEEALSSGLNPDQIERLVQSANTQTFLRMMDKRKQEGAGDLMHEFDPIDSRQVIRIVIDRTGVHVNGPHDDTSNVEAPAENQELPDEMEALRSPPGAPMMQDAVEDVGNVEDEKKKKKNDKKEQKEAEFRTMRLRKLASVLDDEYRQHEWAFEENFEKLAARFQRASVTLPFEAFEKDALAETGDPLSVSVLNALRVTRGLQPLELQNAQEKTAALTDRHVTANSVELEIFEDLLKHAQESHKIQQGLEWVRGQCA